MGVQIEKHYLRGQFWYANSRHLPEAHSQNPGLQIAWLGTVAATAHLGPAHKALMHAHTHSTLQSIFKVCQNTDRIGFGSGLITDLGWIWTCFGVVFNRFHIVGAYKGDVKCGMDSSYL